MNRDGRTDASDAWLIFNVKSFPELVGDGLPGSGKSALQDYWRELCRSRNHAVLRVTAGAFASGESLRKALLETREWKAATTRNRVAVVAGTTLNEIGAAGAAGLCVGSTSGRGSASAGPT